MEKNEDGTPTPDETAELDEITVLDPLFTLIRAAPEAAQAVLTWVAVERRSQTCRDVD